MMFSLLLAGVGFGIAVVPITSVALSALPARHSGMAASATTTAREVGTVIGVAALGSLFNTKLIDFLTTRLIQLDVPPEWRKFVMDAVLTGQFSGSKEAEALYGADRHQGGDRGLRGRPQRREFRADSRRRGHPRFRDSRLLHLHPGQARAG